MVLESIPKMQISPLNYKKTGQTSSDHSCSSTSKILNCCFLLSYDITHDTDPEKCGYILYVG